MYCKVHNACNSCWWRRNPSWQSAWSYKASQIPPGSYCPQNPLWKGSVKHTNSVSGRAALKYSHWLWCLIWPLSARISYVPKILPLWKTTFVAVAHHLQESQNPATLWSQVPQIPPISLQAFHIQKIKVVLGPAILYILRIWALQVFLGFVHVLLFVLTVRT